MDYVESLLQSIDQVVYHRLRDQKFDETIICTIVDNSKANLGLYIVSDGAIKFEAYSELTDYKVDTAVRVNIPKGDYSQKKYIVGKSVSEKNGNQPIIYNSPSAEILDISGNLFSGSGAKIAANGTNEEKLIWSIENLNKDYANSIYDSILVRAKFQTFFAPYTISQGVYGLRLKTIIAPKKSDDKTICRIYDLDSRDMFGDPYNFLLPSNQEAKFNFDLNENIQQISLYLYQNKDFKYRKDSGDEIEFITLAENISVSDIYISLGTALSGVNDNTVKIYTDDDLSYNSSNGTNQKIIKLLWYNKDVNNRYIGFSDGVVDEGYDEMAYDSAMGNHNRLMLQASQGNIPNDYAGFELGARMSEIDSISVALKKLIDTELYNNLKKFRNDLAPVNDEAIKQLFNDAIKFVEQDGQVIIQQLSHLLGFYSQGLRFAAAADKQILRYSGGNEQYYLDTEINGLELIEKVSGLRSSGEEPLFGKALEPTVENGVNKWVNWKTIDGTGSLGKFIKDINEKLVAIKQRVIASAANYLGTYNNWIKNINDILSKIEKYTLDLQKISIGQAHPMYALNDSVPQPDEELKQHYSSKALFESTYNKDDNKIWLSGEGILNRVIAVSGGSQLKPCELLSSNYIQTNMVDNNEDGVDDNANKYQIYWYYERNGYSPKEGENTYGGPGWCEISDSGVVNGVGRFDILNLNNKNIGLPQSVNGSYPAKPDKADVNGYLSISFSTNRPDIKEERVKCVIIYNHQKYESNILTFTNEDPAAGPELTNAIQLIHGKNSRDIYACYNADNTLTNASDKVTARELRIEYLNERGEPETGEDSTLIGSTVYWYVPTGVTMLTANNKDLEESGFECGSAVERTYQILTSVIDVKCNGQPMICAGSYWKQFEDEANNYPRLTFNDTGTEVTFKIKTESGDTSVTEIINGKNFTYGNNIYEVTFNQPTGLKYITNRACNNNTYTYQGKSYDVNNKDDKPPHCTLVEQLNGIVVLTFNYTTKDLFYGGIKYQFAQNYEQIISSEGKKYVIRNNQVTLIVDEPDQYDRKGFAYYYKTINSIDDLTFKYRIKEHYSQSFVNNTILCKVVKNNRVLEDSKMFTFSSQGINGTNYSLVIDAEDGAHIFWDDEYKFSLSLFDYDGNQIPFMNPPTITCTNQSSITLSPKSSNENGVLSYKGTVHAMEQGSEVMTVKVTQPWPIDSDDIVNLEKIQPIAYTENLSYIAEVPTEIIYDSSGSNPTYYKEPLSLYEKMSNGDLKLVEGGGWIIRDGNLNKYFPRLQGQQKNGKYTNGLTILKPLNMYVSNNDDPCILEYRNESNTIIWQQPIIVTQNRFPSTLLNNWDSSLQINTDDGIILSNLVGAGRKNNDNSFSGVLMGDVDKADINNTNGGVFSNPHTGIGLYGFYSGEQSFGFNVNGTAFIGKAGGGRIAFDGNQGFIYSANWLFDKNNNQRKNPFIYNFKTNTYEINEGSKQGMAIDLTNGHIDAYDFKLSSQGIQLNASPEAGESYFIIGDDTDNSKSCLKYDKNGTLTLRVNAMELIGTTENPNLLNNTGPWFYDSENNITQSWYRTSGERLIRKAEDNVIEVYGDNKSLTTLSQSSINLKLNNQYTLSGKIKIPSTEKEDQVRIGFFIGGTSSQYKLQELQYNRSQYGQWRAFEFTVTLNALEYNLLKIEFSIPVIFFKNLKLEHGSQATDWTASPQDVEQQKLQSSLNQDYIFNQLTNGGRTKGIYLGDYNNNGSRELFINANYISTGTIKDDTTNGTNLSINLNDGQITGKKVTIQGDNNSYIKCEDGKITINADELLIGGSSLPDRTMSGEDILNTLVDAKWDGIYKDGDKFLISADAIKTGYFSSETFQLNGYSNNRGVFIKSNPVAKDDTAEYYFLVGKQGGNYIGYDAWGNLNINVGQFHLRSTKQSNAGDYTSIILSNTVPYDEQGKDHYFFVGRWNNNADEKESYIKLANNGKLRIKTPNFNLNTDGSVSVTGTIYASGGSVGGWSIENKRLYISGVAPGTVNYVGLYSNNQDVTTKIAQSNRSDWRIIAGPDFGITASGEMYASNVHLTGEIKATSGTIGGVTISGGYGIVGNGWKLSSGGGEIAGWAFTNFTTDGKGFQHTAHPNYDYTGQALHAPRYQVGPGEYTQQGVLAIPYQEVYFTPKGVYLTYYLKDQDNNKYEVEWGCLTWYWLMRKLSLM